MPKFIFRKNCRQMPWLVEPPNYIVRFNEIIDEGKVKLTAALMAKVDPARMEEIKSREDLSIGVVNYYCFHEDKRELEVFPAPVADTEVWYTRLCETEALNG
jgi:hypothetical protein